MRRNLNLRQRLFVAALLGPARGVLTTAARMAGYRSAAVEGCRLMKNPQIRELIRSYCEARVERSLQVFDEALSAIKSKPFPYKGTIIYSDPEPDRAIRMRAADRLLDYLLLSNPEDRDDQLDESANNEEEAAIVKKAIASLDPSDINLIRGFCEIDVKLQKTEQERSDDDDESKRSRES
jgi:hypothetical protein